MWGREAKVWGWVYRHSHLKHLLISVRNWDNKIRFMGRTYPTLEKAKNAATDLIVKG